MRQLPLSRTLGRLSEKGVKKTSYMLLAVLIGQFLPYFRKKIRYLAYKLLSNKNVVTNVSGSKMWLDLKDKGISRYLFLYEKREPISTDYLLSAGILKEGDVVLDIGANIGYYVLIESRLVGDSGKVYAIEPVSSNVKILKQNLSLNDCMNVEVFQLAMGAKVEKSQVYISSKSNVSAMEQRLAGGDIVGTEEVNVTTVDSFLMSKNRPKLIRMDVEGYEYHIIKGMSQTLKNNIKILMELHPHDLHPDQMEELLQILEKNKFKVRFAIYEHKVIEHKVVQSLMRKGGDKLPLIFSNITIDGLRKQIQINSETLVCPHILFSK